MESNRIYEDSKDELIKVQKQLGTSNVSIDMNKLDSESRGAIISALQTAIDKRKRDIDSVILGVQ